MNATEAATLCRYVRAAAPQQAIDEFTPTIWADLLADIRLDDAKEAVREVLARQPFIAPAEIIAQVKRIRSKRIAEHAPVNPPPGLVDDPRQLAAWQRDLARRIGDGELIDPNYAYEGLLKPRDMKALMAPRREA